MASMPTTIQIDEMASAIIPTGQDEQQLTLYQEPVTTPGLVPSHLKRAAASSHPIIEIAQRFLAHLKPGSSATLEKVLALIALYQVVSPVLRYTKQFCLQSFTSSISIPEHDPVAQEIIQWFSSEVINKSMTTSATIVTGTGTGEAGRYQADIFTGYMMGEGRGAQAAKRQSNEVQCLPPIGKKFFWVGFRPFLFARTGVRGSSDSDDYAVRQALLEYRGTPPNSIILFTPGWSLQPLKDFIKKCHDFKITNTAGTTNVYFSSGKVDTYSGSLWSTVIKATRKLDTVDMDDDMKAELVNDAEYYYSEESKKFFADCGIPYRRGYLFHGPPGTGKTSFSAALAGHLSCDLYIINVATGDVSDGQLHRLFLALPQKCIVVIEDIDSCGIGREQGPASTVPHPPGALPATMPPGMEAWNMQNGANPHATVKKRNMVTLSGLLNAIDGNASAEGRLLIMTSNNPDILDEALTRPGRIDKKVYFGRMMPNATKGIFKRLIGRAATATLRYTAEQIEEYATIFSAKIPPDTFTPAQVQNFLQNCRGDPVNAMQEVDAWITETRGQASDEDKENAPLVPLAMRGLSPESAATLIDEEELESAMARLSAGVPPSVLADLRREVIAALQDELHGDGDDDANDTDDAEAFLASLASPIPPMSCSLG